MDEPPRKRRKTSSPVHPSSSPLRQPPRRPSFASPTKASLARNHPNLLPTRTPPPENARTGRKAEQSLSLDGAAASPKETEDTHEQIDSPSRRAQEQESVQREALFPLPKKRPQRAAGALRRSPLAEAPAAQRNQLSRPVEEVLHLADQNEKVKKQLPNPELLKRKQEKARLQYEIEELEAQVSRCANEIVAEQQRAADDVLPPAQRTDLIKFLTKVSGVDEQAERPIPVSSLLCSFLPFSTRIIPLPRQKQAEKPIASHRPLELKDPLPYLQMFTSFNLSTQLGLPRGEASSRVHQKHTIDIDGPQKLLSAQMSIDIDCLSNKVIDMNILRLSPWAERELGTFMRAKARENDLGNACWALDSFWDLAAKRAHYWHRCEKAFTKFISGRTDAPTEDMSAVNGKSSILWRKDLSRHLGRDLLIVQDKHVLLKINWRIAFDWTGEAESVIDAECAVPAVWKETDAGDTFSKVPETFQSLLHAKGAFEATRIMVALLFDS